MKANSVIGFYDHLESGYHVASEACSSAWNKMNEATNNFSFHFVSDAFIPLYCAVVETSRMASEILNIRGETLDGINQLIEVIPEGVVKSITQVANAVILAIKLGFVVKMVTDDISVEGTNISEEDIKKIVLGIAQGTVIIVSHLVAGAAKVCSVFFAIFTALSIWNTSKSRDETLELLSDLKRKRHLAFLAAVPDEYQKKSSDVDKFSNAQLKENVKEIKLQLKLNHKNRELAASMEKANKAFLAQLKKEITEKPKIMTAHFQVIVKKETTPPDDLPASAGAETPRVEGIVGESIFNKILSNGVLDSNSAEGVDKAEGIQKMKSQKIVKKLKKQLRQKVFYNASSMCANLLDLLPSIMTLALILGASCPPIGPIVAALGGAAALASLANICYNYYRIQKFNRKMEKLTE